MTAVAAPPALKLTLTREAFRDAVAAVAPAVARSSTLPVLKMLKMEAKDGVLTLTATNLDEWVTKVVPAEIEGEGVALVSADTLSRLLRELPPEPIRLTMKGDRVAINCGKVRSTLATLPPDEFPQLDDDGQATVCTLGAGALRRLAERTAFAASLAESRDVLQGVLVEMRSDRLRMVATDRHKLARVDEPVEGVDAGDVVVPPSTFEHLARCFDDDDNVTVARGEQWVSFANATGSVRSRLVEGRYPAIDPVIPEDHKIMVVVDRLALLASLQRAIVVVEAKAHSDGTRHQRATLDFQDGTVRISGSDQDVGTLDDTLPCVLEGKPIEIACNARYLVEILRRIDSERARIEMTAPTRAVVLRPDAPDARSLFLLMPHRL